MQTAEKKPISVGANLFIFFPAALLLLGATLKSLDVGSSPNTAVYFFDARALTIAIVIAEVLVAFWLLSGLARHQALISVVFLFTFFLTVNLVKWSRGDIECGCFGSLSLSPRTSAVLDGTALACILSAFRLKTSMRPTRGIAVLFCGCIFCAACVWVSLSLTTSKIDLAGEIENASGIVVLEPSDWVGHRLPILDFIDENQRLRDGVWTLLLYHTGCELCKRRIEWHIASDSVTNIAFIELPPLSKREKIGLPRIHWTNLTQKRRWFVEAPVELTIEYGVVTQVVLRDKL